MSLMSSDQPAAEDIAVSAPLNVSEMLVFKSDVQCHVKMSKASWDGDVFKPTGLNHTEEMTLQQAVLN